MKKLFAALLGLVGFAWWRKRTEPEPQADPADELRAKLAEAREPEPEPQPDPEPTAPPADVDTRRSDVHDRARQAIDDLSPSGE